MYLLVLDIDMKLRRGIFFSFRFQQLVSFFYFVLGFSFVVLFTLLVFGTLTVRCLVIVSFVLITLSIMFSNLIYIFRRNLSILSYGFVLSLCPSILLLGLSQSYLTNPLKIHYNLSNE